jgi:SAM-dependent methyltransferase
MSDQIIGLQQWFETAPGQHLLHWESVQLDQAVGDVFGYHALQLGLPHIPGLRANRMPHQFTAGQEFDCDFAALPFAENSLDLIVLPHSLEFSSDPHATLREAYRVLVPEGRVVITGLNPTSLWAWRQQRGKWWRRLMGRFAKGSLYLPEEGEFIGYLRLRDWLRLLDFEVESSQFGVWSPAVNSAKWFERMRWMDRLGSRYWPILGSAYRITAVKRVHGMRLLSPAWKKNRKLAGAPVSVANSSNGMRADSHFPSENHKKSME